MFCQTVVIFLCGSLASLSSVTSDDGVTAGVAALGQFPWHATLYRHYEDNDRWDQFCSGVLIHPRYVLTGAVCGSISEPEELRVKLGQVDRDYYTNSSSSVIANVRKIVIPEGYFGLERNYAMDIALLELTESVPLSDNVKPAGVGKTYQEHGRNLILPVWKTDEENSSPVLHWVKLEALPLGQCVTELGEASRLLTNDKVCFINLNGTKVDKGNGGGGLGFTESGRPYVLALTSLYWPLKNDKQKRSILLMTNVTNLEHRAWLQSELHRLDPSSI